MTPLSGKKRSYDEMNLGFQPKPLNKDRAVAIRRKQADSRTDDLANALSSMSVNNTGSGIEEVLTPGAWQSYTKK